ncbi:Uncharacterized protein APZ42_014617 [Daphnia magna]|uniref:Uncharacterized protein n=1 Tax=Daphnia magna TaxID=35525 RepID=A0A162PR85_9CRUS|nr:Uncharacterized protein APZ42_014617 [Daphnia magna]
MERQSELDNGATTERRTKQADYKQTNAIASVPSSSFSFHSISPLTAQFSLAIQQLRVNKNKQVQ